MSDIDTANINVSDIPYAPYYVLSDDTFMSGWGRAEGMINTVVLPCDSLEEVMLVVEYALSRGDQTNTRIVTEKPLSDSTIIYSLATLKTASRWYRGA